MKHDKTAHNNIISNTLNKWLQSIYYNIIYSVSVVLSMYNKCTTLMYDTINFIKAFMFDIIV